MGIDDITLNFDQSNLWALNLCLALIMFGISLDLKVEHFKRVIESPKSALVGLIAQFILLPFVTWLMVVMVQPQPSIALGMILMAACPGGGVANFLTHLSKGNTALSVSLTAIGTFLAIVMTPFNLALWGSLYEPTSVLLKEIHLDAFDLFRSILLLAGLPLSIGMLFAHYFPTAASKIVKAVKPLSIIIFVAFIVMAFSNNIDHFMTYIHTVVFIVFIHNIVALLTGYLTAKTFRLPLADQKSIAIETGIQNSGLGLFLIFSFFGGLGGMAFVSAWWGIWHIVSGLTIAAYWSANASETQPV